MEDNEELGDFNPDTNEDDSDESEPVRDPDDYEKGRADVQSVGTEIRATITRGNDTRDQDKFTIKGRGSNAQEAAEDFDQALSEAEERDFADRLREL